MVLRKRHRRRATVPEPHMKTGLILTFLGGINQEISPRFEQKVAEYSLPESEI